MAFMHSRFDAASIGRLPGWRVGLTVALLVVASAGCGGGAGVAGSAGASPGAASPSEQVASPLTPEDGSADTYTGRLGLDAIEGGCAYLETSDGQRYEVIYPDGWTLQKSPLQLIAPDGSVVAEDGDELTVRGSEADMVSICQIGPIIQATEVEAGP
jgi:hypothetical protein